MDWSTIIIAAISGLPAIIISLATLITAIKTSYKLDGHMTKLLEQTRSISKVEGKVEGIIKGVELNKPIVISDRRE